MRIETVCTGDELLTGLTSDTNSAFFQTQLLERVGEQVSLGVVVGDVRADIEQAVRAAAARSQVVLVSGGLGPTADDLTAECAARVAGVELVENAAALDHLVKRFAERGLKLTDNNRRQALVPAGAEVVLNPVGSAPMFVQRLGEATVFYLPGVPREYRHLVEHQVVPRIAALAEAKGARTYRELLLLKTVGLPESHLDAKVAPLAKLHPKVTFGFRTHLPENHLKLMAEGTSPAEASAALAAAATPAREVLGAHLFAEGAQSMAFVIGEKLKARGETLATAESCTGGLVSQLLTAEPGASEWFIGGAVTYAESAKRRLVGVSAAALAEHGAVSEVVARQMAQGAREACDATWGVAVTGFAGPTGGTDAAPVGTVFVAVNGPGVDRVDRHRFVFDRERVRAFAAHAAMDLLRRSLP